MYIKLIKKLIPLMLLRGGDKIKQIPWINLALLVWHMFHIFYVSKFSFPVQSYNLFETEAWLSDNTSSSRCWKVGRDRGKGKLLPDPNSSWISSDLPEKRVKQKVNRNNKLNNLTHLAARIDTFWDLNWIQMEENFIPQL